MTRKTEVVYTVRELEAALNSAVLMAGRVKDLKDLPEGRRRILHNHMWVLSQILKDHATQQNLSGPEIVFIVQATALFLQVMLVSKSVGKSLVAFQKIAQEMCAEDDKACD